MALSNYGELKASIADTLNRTDMDNQIKDSIALCDAMINRDPKYFNRRMETTATLTFDAAGEASLPADYIAARTVVFQSSPKSNLTFLSASAFDTLYTTSTAGLPINYTILGEKLKAGPVPNSASGAVLRYYQRITALSADSDTNWLLTYYPDIYLYGSLVHTAPYLGEDARLQTWFGLLDRASAELAGEDSRARFSGAPVAPSVNVTIV
tara:strand:+ start:329 stop:958 length:630 start_codon:yes stop_codon:yes gene_type:complete